MEDSVIENISNQTKVEPEDETSRLKAPLLVEMENELAKLESWQKDLLLLRAQGLTYKEIANYLKKPTKNLKVYYGKLIHQLKVKLKNLKILLKLEELIYKTQLLYRLDKNSQVIMCK